MPEHITRKELKKDEIRETLAHGAEAVLSHQRMAWIIGAAALAAALAVFGWRFYSERQSVKAQAALDEAMKAFDARIRVPGEPPSADPADVSYFEEKTKYEDAAKKLSEVASKYSRSRPGQMAMLYAALSYKKLGRYDDAQKWLKQLEGSGQPELASLARFNLADVLALQGKPDDAAKLYRQLMEKPSVLVPKAMVMLSLAGLEAKRNPTEAVKLYEQIKKDYPETRIAEQADQALSFLSPKS